jgi:thiosulfate/3-mercaptopyruvate sulfurtransferase
MGCGSPESPSVSESQAQFIPPQELPSVLVDANWLSQHVNDQNVSILELGQTIDEYHVSHIPNAHFIDWLIDITDPEFPERYMILSKEMLETLLSKLGIEKNSTIVIYDTLNSRLSARMFWTLRYYNHEDIRILDGGKNAWQSAGHEFSSETNQITPTEYLVDQINYDYLSDKDYIESRLRDKLFTLVDGRPAEQYTGEALGKVFHTGTAHAKKGHIYGAQNVPWMENFKEDGTFKSIDDLRKLYEPHHVTSDKTVVTYCNEGLHAAPPWFVLKELLDYPDVRLYDASMAEWGNLDDTLVIMGKRCM